VVVSLLLNLVSLLTTLPVHNVFFFR